MAKAAKKEKPASVTLVQTPVTMVPLVDIIPDASQPRKNFNQEELNELADSIKKHGVLQPIIVRPLFESDGQTKIIVFGERRYRASILAGMESIPAFIKHMTDEEALELQIIENLQRKDVHPMEEAKAFRYLNEHGKTIEDIAGKVGKSTKYVALRLKLTDLIEVFQLAYINGFMDYSDAKLICKQSEDVQISLHAECARYENYIINKGESPSAFLRKVTTEGMMLKSLKLNSLSHLLSDEINNLDKATFGLMDTQLYPEMGSCMKCIHNSANTPMLFIDDEMTCNNSVCFATKTRIQFQNRLKELSTDPNMTFVYNGWGTPYSSQEKQQIEDAKELGLQVLDRSIFETAPSHPGEKPIWENYFKEKWEEMDEEDRADDGEETIKQWYDDEIEEWEEEKKEFDDFNDADCKKAFVVAGTKVGKIINILLKKSIERTSLNGNDEVDSSSEIAKIISRENRAKELDGIKVWEGIRKLIEDKDNRTELFITGALSKQERAGVATAIYESLNYQNKKWVKEEFGEDIIEERFKDITELGLNQLSRMFIIDKLVNAYGSHLNDLSTNQIAYRIIKSYLPSQVARIELEQQEKATSRAERVAKKIESLKQK